MANKKPTDSYKKKPYKKYYNKQNNIYNRPSNKKQAIENKKSEPVNEFNSYTSSTARSYYYFGLNIFDFYSPEQLADIVKDPMGNNEILRELSLVLYGTNGAYTNTVDYMCAMPTLSKVIVTHGQNKSKKKQNKGLMESTLRKVKDKEIIRDALFKGMVEGLAFYYFETTKRPLSNKKTMTDYDVDCITEINELGLNASIISLPADYTRIVGIKNSSYVIAFDLNYFTLADGEPADKKIKKYPKEIRDAYVARQNQALDSNGNWVILDNKKTIVHKIRSKRDEKYGRPLVLAAISDILYGDYFTQTKRNILDEINNNVIYETFPEGKDKGSSALTKNQQKAQHDTVKNAVLKKNNRGGTSFFSVAAGTKINKIDVSNADILNSDYESDLNDKIALDLGIAGSLLNGVGSGSYSAQEQNLELITSQIFQWIEGIQSELNKCIAENIIKDTKNWVEVRYLPLTHVNKTKMVGYMKDLYLQGNGSISLWAASCGIEPEVFFALLDQELEEGVYDKYPTHQTSFTFSGKDNNNTDDKGGRPTTDDPSDNTVRSRNNDGNSLPSPSDNK